MVLIAFHGQQGAGKTTLADRVAVHLRAIGRRVAVIGFADAIKRTCWELFGIEYQFDEPQDLKNAPTIHGLSKREIWQRIGMAAREIWADVWVARTMAEVDHSAADVVLFHDLRFANEAAAVHERDGVVIHLTDTPYGVGSHVSDAVLGNCHVDIMFSSRELGLVPSVLAVVDLVRRLEGRR